VGLYDYLGASFVEGLGGIIPTNAGKCFVRPSIAYLESVTKVIGM
jgi:hypothetical protein